MSKSSRRAGQNIRALEFQRRIQAIASFASAGLALGMPFLYTWAIEMLVQPIATANPSQPPVSVNLPLIFYGLALLIAVSLGANGAYWWKRANHAGQGARGEEETAQVIEPLEHEGWQIEYGMRLGSGLGDADIVCISPQNKAYVIDVKSHRGEVTSKGDHLYRRMGKTTYSFEKNFLNQAMRQAIQVRQQKNLRFVTPIVAFSNAKVTIPERYLKKVYVVEKSQLVDLLRSLG